MRGNFKCLCGFIGNSAHTRSCDQYQKEVSRVETNAKNYIEDIYLKTISIVECIEIVKKREKTKLPDGMIRKIIDARVDALNIRHDMRSEKYQEKKQAKAKKTTKKRYGVDNISKLKVSGWSKNNAIEYKKLPLLEDLDKYRSEVSYYTKKSVSRIKKRNEMPEQCYYTDITFNDVLLDAVNPNDPFKRTIDHVVPITEAFLLDWPPEKTGSEDNIVFCLRCVNTLKHNTDIERFTTVVLPLIKERLKNES